WIRTRLIGSLPSDLSSWMIACVDMGSSVESPQQEQGQIILQLARRGERLDGGTRLLGAFGERQVGCEMGDQLRKALRAEHALAFGGPCFEQTVGEEHQQ